MRCSIWTDNSRAQRKHLEKEMKEVGIIQGLGGGWGRKGEGGLGGVDTRRCCHRLESLTD